MTDFASRITHQPLSLESSNFTGMFLSMSCGAPPIFGLPPPDNFGVMAPWNIPIFIKKITNFASHITPQPLGLESSSFTWMFLNMSCGAPPIFGLPPPDNFGVMALEMEKKPIEYDRFCVAHNSSTIEPRVFKLHRNVPQHKLWCTSYFWITPLW